MVAINIRCLDDFAEERRNVEVTTFDGRNWEEAVKAFRF
jgi:hypothetical protein